MHRNASIVMICLCLAIPVYATSVIPLSFEQLVNESESVVFGRVSDVRAQWTDDRRFIESVVTIEVLRGMKGGARESITVRKVSFGVGVERIFPLHATVVDHIDVVRRGKVRRAKLYYLRDLRGKAARIKEKDTRNKAQAAK